MKSFLLLLLSGVLFLSNTYSRPTFRKSYEIRSAGVVMNMHWLQLNDTRFSPLKYNGPGGEFNLMSVKGIDNKRRHFSLGARADYLWNSLEFNAIYLQPKFMGGLTFLVNDLSTENSLSYIGGNFSASSRMYRFINEDPDHLYWATSYTLDFHYVFDMGIGEYKRAMIELNLPIAGAASRPSEENLYTYQLPGFGEYMKRLHQNLGFATWNTMQAVNVRLLMDLSRTRKSSVSLGYEFDFARFSRPEPVIYLSNSLFIRLFFDVLVW
jgi:hypothetical protein